MPIQHSDALLTLEQHFKSLEKQSIDFPLLELPVFVRPITCEQMDLLSSKTGQEYNCRLLQLTLVYADGSPVFLETDLHRMRNGIDPAIIHKLANQVVNCIFSSFGTLKN